MLTDAEAQEDLYFTYDKVCEDDHGTHFADDDVPAPPPTISSHGCLFAVS